MPKKIFKIVIFKHLKQTLSPRMREPSEWSDEFSSHHPHPPHRYSATKIIGYIFITEAQSL